MLHKTRLSSLFMLISMGIFVAMWAGCGDSSSLPADVADAEAQITTEDVDGLYGVEMMSEDDPSKALETALENLEKSGAAIPPENIVGYGRRITIRRERFDFVRSDDGLSAVATVLFRIRGLFVIKTKDTTTETRGLIFKPIDQTMVRKIHFIRNLDTNALSVDNVHRRWIADAVTFAIGKSKNGTLSLTGNVSIIIKSGSGGETQNFTTSDPVNFYFSKDNLPSASAGDTVRVEVAIANSELSDPPIGFLHRGEPRGLKRGRVKHPFNDSGVNGDAQADDGIYTVEFVVQNVNDFVGYHAGSIDFFSHSTLFDDTLPYNALTMHFPYQKQ